MIRRTLGCLLAASLVFVVALGFFYKQDISDYIRASSFEPSARVAEVMSELQLTARGERLFLASQPTVDGSQHFNDQCAEVDHSEEGHVLGCYTQDRIRLFDVTDERISDIVEVTAAHELLHAAFARLSDRQRTNLTRELENAFDELSSQDLALVERMAVYEHLSPAAFANELHSVLGTEVRDLPDSLTAHYARFFSDRDALLNRFDAFQSVFTDLQNRATGLESEMSTLRADVENRNQAYEAAVELFNIDAAELNARNERFEFSDRAEEYAQLRDALLDRRAELEATLAQLQADVDRYNAMRDELEQLGQKSADLDQLLNSSLAPVTTRPTD